MSKVYKIYKAYCKTCNIEYVIETDKNKPPKIKCSKCGKVILKGDKK